MFKIRDAYAQLNKPWGVMHAEAAALVLINVSAVDGAFSMRNRRACPRPCDDRETAPAAGIRRAQIAADRDVRKQEIQTVRHRQPLGHR